MKRCDIFRIVGGTSGTAAALIAQPSPNTLLSVPQTARTMPLVITPEVGIPLPFEVTPEEVEQFRDRAAAACATLRELIDAGGELELTTLDSTVAHNVFTGTTPLKVGKTPPGAILKLEAMLTQYDHEFLGANRRITNFVTNRLLEETEDEDPKVRLKALELLGKRRGVNLFSDQMEITVKHKPTEDLEGELTTLLSKYMGDAEIVESRPVIDLDAELAMLDDVVEDFDVADEPVNDT